MGRINGLYSVIKELPFIYPLTIKSRTAIVVLLTTNLNFKNSILNTTGLFTRPSGPHSSDSIQCR